MENQFNSQRKRQICAVAICQSPQPELGYSYHRFPKDKVIRHAWINACRRKDSFNPDTAKVCSLHFEEEAFERDLRSELMPNEERKKRRAKILKSNAIPVLKLTKEHVWCRSWFLQK